MTRTNQARLILGSASPRRLDLLAQIGITPDEIRPADIDETPRRDEDARTYVRRMAAEKAEAVPAEADDIVFIRDGRVTCVERRGSSA